MKFDESQLAFIESNDYPYFCLANAGSGKSTSLLAKAKRLALAPGREGKIVILCFNNSIRNELTEKIQIQGLNRLGIEASTIHALGRSFVEEALNKSGARLQIITQYKNRHLYYGVQGKEEKIKYQNYPGLLEKAIQLVGGDSSVQSMIYAERESLQTLGQCVLAEGMKSNNNGDFDPEKSPNFRPIVTEIKQVLKKFKETSEENLEYFGKILAHLYIENILTREKYVDFGRFFFTKHFYRRNFTAFIHNTAIEFVFKKDLFGRFADEALDCTPLAMPMFYLYAKEERYPQSYSEYSELLSDELGAIALSDLIAQVQQWKELDFDSMLSLGVYALLKLKHNYHALLVDETQDLSLLYWYLAYEVFPKYMINDREKRVFFVGDHSQAINRWNGASTERFIALANSHSRGQLIYTYRCPEAIVAKAQEIKDRAKGTKIDLPEDRFISAAPQEFQPGKYETIEALDPSQMDAFMALHGYIYGDIVVLGRTNNDLLTWQMWALVAQIPVKEILANKLELDSEKAKCLLAMVALADPLYSPPKIAVDALSEYKTREFTERFHERAHSPDTEDKDELILRSFMTSNMKDDDELSEDEKREIATGKGAIKCLRAWYSANTLGLRSNFQSLMMTPNLVFNTTPKGISLSTIHRFKGREKNVVILQSNSWANICRRALDPASQTEEDCLAYVGVTRAKWATHVIKKNSHPIL